MYIQVLRENFLVGLRTSLPLEALYLQLMNDLGGKISSIELLITRKRFLEKPIVAFTNSTVWFHVLALSAVPNHT